MELLSYGPFISREQAKAQGLKQYSPGTPCHRGHVSVRSVRNGHCFACKRENYRRDNPPKPPRPKKSKGGYPDSLFIALHGMRHTPKEISEALSLDFGYVGARLSKLGLKIQLSAAEHVENDARNAARLAGQSTYESHRPCPHGITTRYTGSKGTTCTVCNRRSGYGKRQVILNVCEHCGVEFTSQRKSRWCSPVCRAGSWTKQKLATDPAFRVMQRQLKRLRQALKTQGVPRNKRVNKGFGCSALDLKAHLEALFLPGMSWENYGYNGWHVDHIRPIASFDLNDPEQFAQCFHYTNLQPLWAADNLAKSDTWEPNEAAA